MTIFLVTMIIKSLCSLCFTSVNSVVKGFQLRFFTPKPPKGGFITPAMLCKIRSTISLGGIMEEDIFLKRL